MNRVVRPTACRDLLSRCGPKKNRSDDFLKKSESDRSRQHWLERFRNAIRDEEMANRSGESWSIAKDYVRSLLHEMSEAVGSQVSQREDETSV